MHHRINEFHVNFVKDLHIINTYNDICYDKTNHRICIIYAPLFTKRTTSIARYAKRKKQYIVLMASKPLLNHDSKFNISSRIRCHNSSLSTFSDVSTFMSMSGGPGPEAVMPKSEVNLRARFLGCLGKGSPQPGVVCCRAFIACF